jgi:outer membrane lipoprotein-sorting protein
MKKIVLLICLSYTCIGHAMDIKSLVKKIDELYRSDSSIADVEMEVKTPHWKRTMKMQMWSKGKKRTFIVIKSPRKDAGIATLKKGKEMWNYFPKTNKVIKIPPSMMMGSWMGSDFTNDDLVKDTTLENDYKCKMLPEEAGLYVIECIPNKETISVWGKVVSKVDKKSSLVTEQAFYDEKGRKKRLMEFSDIRNIGGKTIPTTMKLIPLNKKDKYTIVKFTKAKFNIYIKESIFTRKNLQKRR